MVSCILHGAVSALKQLREGAVGGAAPVAQGAVRACMGPGRYAGKRTRQQ